VEGTHQTGCLLGSNGTLAVGGVIDLKPMSTLTVSPVVAQSCQFDGVLVGAGKLLKTGTGTQVIGARALPQFWTAPRPATSFSGGTSVVAGTLASITSDAFGTGPVSIDGANARIRIDADDLVIANAFAFNAMTVLDTNGFDATLDGASSGSVLVRKTGTGTLRWNGARAHTGMTLIDGGVLRLNDSLAGPVTVAGSGTLAGSATLAGGLNVLSGGRLRLAIDGGTHDRFVAPTASVSGGTLQLDLIAPAPIGSTIELVDVSGPAAVNGVFANVAEGGFLHDGDTGYRLSYVGGDGNDITLTALRVPLPPQNLVATPGNAQPV
jgi:autotransporter-associated beta strand protein